jgi:MFS family permease
MRIFLLIWWGQMVSLLGSSLTEFALGVWVYQETGSITQFALISLCIHLPNLFISPFAGAIVDRWNRRWAMILSDSVAGIAASTITVLLFLGHLQIWHIYVAVTINSFFSAFQWPAYMAAIAQLVPPQHLGRANGLVQIARANAKILGPTIAGFLVAIVQIQGILLIDFCSFIFALTTLLCVRFPQLQIEAVVPEEKAQKNKQEGIQFDRLWQEVSEGWTYIKGRPGLMGLTVFFAVTSFTEGMLQVLFWPLVLNSASSRALGIVLSIAGCGMLLGSLAISAWGGPKRRVHGILMFAGLQGLCLCLGGLPSTTIVAAIGGFGYLFARPIVVSCNQTIWQRKVPLDLQGRVFALQMAVEKALLVVSLICAGPLADQVFEPLMAPDGLLANSIGLLIGVGPGRGIGLLFMLMGSINIIATAIAYRTPHVRRVEKELPDAIISHLGLT